MVLDFAVKRQGCWQNLTDIFCDIFLHMCMYENWAKLEANSNVKLVTIRHEIIWFGHIANRRDWGETSRYWGDVFNTLTGGTGGENTGLFTLLTSDRAQGTGMKLSQGRFKLDIRWKFLSQKVFEHWNRLPRQVITAATLTELKKRLDNALRYGVLCRPRSCTLVIFVGSFHLRRF